VKINGLEITAELLYKWTKIWLSTENSNEERHKRRIQQIKLIEEENFK
jgi:ribose 5-phosphate isomerase RpiB